MGTQTLPKTLILFLLLCTLVGVGSYGAAPLWNDKPEGVVASLPDLAFSPEMSVGDFGTANGLDNPALKKIFVLESPTDLTRNILDFEMNQEQIILKTEGERSLGSEYQSKNWLKIPVKFGFWLLFLGVVFFLLRNKRITPKVRKGLYLGATVLFGVVLTSDPSPMGTVKDAIHLYATQGVIFPPRLIALTVFLLTVLLANKFICSWGCQLGVLQDLIFRLGRNPKDTRSGALPQVKIPFLVTNSVRVAFLATFTLASFAWGMELIEPIDPFRVFKPMSLTLVAAGFIALLLISSLFVYRPWCHFACPFGLVGWLVEKLSIHKIHVDYEACISCEACAKACPSTVMEAILKRQSRGIPDCFSCGTCINVCPSDAISFGRGRRVLPPQGKFDHATKDKSEH